MIRSILMSLIFCLAASATLAQTRVIDGDTFELDDKTIRIFGIDAPETGQECLDDRARPWPCGKIAEETLTRFLAGQAVRCEGREEDPYGRTIAICQVGGEDLGEKLIGAGMAWAFLRYSDRYALDEAKARAAGLGIWQGEAVPAWGHREERWKLAQKLAPNGCPIKGNISNSGKIYHTPWSRSYDRTKIDPSKGERWFCDEAEALAAGWRAPRR